MSDKPLPLADGWEFPDLDWRALAPTTEDYAVTIDDTGRIAIAAPPDDLWGKSFEPFVVGDQHTLYEWAMVLGDRHPYAPWGDITSLDRAAGRREVIECFEESWAIFKTAVEAYRTRKVQRVRLGWTDVEEPADSTLLVFGADDVLSIVDELGADGRVIAALLATHRRQASSQKAIGLTDDTSSEVTPANETPDSACTPTISPQDIRKILEELGSMPEGKAWRAAKSKAPDKHIPRQRVRDAIDALGWHKKRGRPGSNT